jgi:hypothetical protein
LSRKVPVIRDNALESHMDQNITNKILSRIYGLCRGKVFTPKGFLDLGSHETVLQSLSRLAKEGKIRHLLRGVCEYPAFSRLLNAPADPDTDAIAQGIGQNNVDKSVPEPLRGKIDLTECNRAVREARYVTSWIYEIIKQLAAEDQSLNA